MTTETEYIDYGSQADLRDAVGRYHGDETILTMDVLNANKTLRITRQAELIGDPEAGEDGDPDEFDLAEFVSRSSLAELQEAVEEGKVTADQVYEAETADEGRGRQNVTNAFAPDED